MSFFRTGSNSYCIQADIPPVPGRTELAWELIFKEACVAFPSL